MIRQLINDPQKTILLSSIPVDTPVKSASAVVGNTGSSQLIHVGDSVKFSASLREVCRIIIIRFSCNIFVV